MSAPNLKITEQLARRILAGDPAALTTLERRCDDAVAEHAGKAAKKAERATEGPQKRPQAEGYWSEDAGAKACKKRSGGRCEHPDGCLQRATHVHHRQGRGFAGCHHPELLLHLCEEHHRWVHANPEASYEDGSMVRRVVRSGLAASSPEDQM